MTRLQVSFASASLGRDELAVSHIHDNSVDIRQLSPVFINAMKVSIALKHEPLRWAFHGIAPRLQRWVLGVLVLVRRVFSVMQGGPAAHAS